MDIAQKALRYAALAAICAAALWVSVCYLLPVFLPFIIAWLLSLALRKPVKLLHERLKFPKKLASALLVTVSVGFLIWILYLVAGRAYDEIVSLTETAGEFIERLKNDEKLAAELIEKISSFVPFIDIRPRLISIWSDIDTSLGSLLLSAVDKLSVRVLPMLSGIISFVPNALLWIFVVFISAYYFSSGETGADDIMALFPKKACDVIHRLRDEFKQTVGGFLRAYSLIMIITFTELFVFFSVLGVKYAFWIAFFTAIIDILPVLGTGTVIIPWALFALLTGDMKTGIGLLIAYAVITVVREVTEPRIVGKSVGISPLISLISMYAGLKLFGAAGLFVFPLGVILAQNIIKRKAQGRHNE